MITKTLNKELVCDHYFIVKYNQHGNNFVFSSELIKKTDNKPHSLLLYSFSHL